MCKREREREKGREKINKREKICCTGKLKQWREKKKKNTHTHKTIRIHNSSCLSIYMFFPPNPHTFSFPFLSSLLPLFSYHFPLFLPLFPPTSIYLLFSFQFYNIPVPPFLHSSLSYIFSFPFLPSLSLVSSLLPPRLSPFSSLFLPFLPLLLPPMRDMIRKKQ